MDYSVWKNSKGVNIKIEDMNDFHIKACIKMLKSNKDLPLTPYDKQMYIAEFTKEQAKRLDPTYDIKWVGVDKALFDDISAEVCITTEGCVNCIYRENNSCSKNIIKRIKPTSSCYNYKKKEKQDDNFSS